MIAFAENSRGDTSEPDPFSDVQTDADGRVVSLRGVAIGEQPGTYDIALCEGKIAEVKAVSQSADFVRLLVLPALVNAHAHANRAFAVVDRRPRSLGDAVQAARAERELLSAPAFQARACRLFERSLAHGTLAIRTHTDVDAAVGMRAVEGVGAAAKSFSGLLDVEMVAFANASADPVRLEVQQLLGEAVRNGARLLGAVPSHYENPRASARAIFELAARLGVGVDLHLAEHLDPRSTDLESAVDDLVAFGLEQRVTFSHGCALAAMEDLDAQRILDKMARAGVTLVVLPELNLYLQDRSDNSSPRLRGIAPARLASRAGVAVRLGTDNVRDWFFPFGDGDLLESGHVAALAAHIDTPDQLIPAMCGGRRGLCTGMPADLLLLRASSFDDALARRPSGRILLRRGRSILQGLAGTEAPATIGTAPSVPT